MKEMVRKTLECRDIHLYVDIHGHSRQKNLFVYGCSQSNTSKFVDKQKGLMAHREKVLPVMLTKQIDFFSYSDCAFSVQKCKESTGRVSKNTSIVS